MRVSCAAEEHPLDAQDTPVMPRLFAGLVFVAVCTVAVPLWVIRPFAPQDPAQLTVALAFLRWSPWVTPICWLAALYPALIHFRRGSDLRPHPGAPGPRPERRSPSKLRRAAWRGSAVLGLILLTASAVMARVNIFERMFHRIDAAEFVPAARADDGAKEMVLTFRSGLVARAYPVHQMAYHHVLNDVVGGSPIVVTYCTLCHTGLVWSRVVRGKTLTFRLAGINNQNMLMKDEETGTFWQQVTGEALSGPLRGESLALARSDELTFGLWTAESPGGTVLAKVPADVASYARAGWEDRIRKLPTVIDVADTNRAPRELMIGVSVGNVDRAYPLESVLSQSPLLDQVGESAIVLLVGPDETSIRGFVRSGTPPLELFATTGGAWSVRDTSGREWGFDGCPLHPAPADPVACLVPVALHKDFWFDWHHHHPTSTVYAR